MNNIDKIIQILKERSDDIRTDGHHEYSCIYSEKYREIAEIIDKNLTIPDVLSSVFLVQHKETLINYGLFSVRKKAENYINKNTDLFKIQEIEIV